MGIAYGNMFQTTAVDTAKEVGRLLDLDLPATWIRDPHDTNGSIQDSLDNKNGKILQQHDAVVFVRFWHDSDANAAESALQTATAIRTLATKRSEVLGVRRLTLSSVASPGVAIAMPRESATKTLTKGRALEISSLALTLQISDPTHWYLQYKALKPDPRDQAIDDLIFRVVALIQIFTLKAEYVWYTWIRHDIGHAKALLTARELLDKAGVNASIRSIPEIEGLMVDLQTKFLHLSEQISSAEVDIASADVSLLNLSSVLSSLDASESTSVALYELLTANLKHQIAQMRLEVSFASSSAKRVEVRLSSLASEATIRGAQWNRASTYILGLFASAGVVQAVGDLLPRLSVSRGGETTRALYSLIFASNFSSRVALILIIWLLFILILRRIEIQKPK